MFDATRSGADCVSAEPNDDRPSRRQYTLKGVEDDTIRLMRDAASKEGMKIGSWVSLRMREAAEKALVQNSISGGSVAKMSGSDNSIELINQLCLAIKTQREEADARFSRLERELHEITSGQRTILSSLLAGK